MRKAHIVLALVGVVLLAGCLHGGSGNGTGDNADIDTGNETTVAVVVGLDAQAQQNITGTLNQSEQQLLRRAQLAPGNLSAAEQQRATQLRQEMQQARQQAMEDARTRFNSTVEGSETLSVEGNIQQGSSSIYLVSGNPSEILGLLNESGVQAIASQQQYNQLQQQMQQAPAPGGRPPQPQP